MDASFLDERHQPGANNPPEPTAFEAIQTHIDDLYLEAKNWLDGQPIDSQAQADEVGRLLGLIREAEKAADEQRRKENEPHDKAKAEVQARYAPLIADTKAVRGKTVLAAEACKRALAPWLEKVEAEKRAAAEAARREAEEKARIAAEAARAAAGTADLEALEQAEAMVKEAKQARTDANRADNDRAHAAGHGRAVTLRTHYTPVLTDGVTALMHFYGTRKEEIEGFLTRLAEAEVRAGKRQIPGFIVNEERRAV